MPTALQANGFTIKILYNDHAPAHVHVYKSGTEAVITLDPVILLRVWRMKRMDAAAAVRIVKDNIGMLLKAWRDIHG
jgi:hypothetical protein